MVSKSKHRWVTKCDHEDVQMPTLTGSKVYTCRECGQRSLVLPVLRDKNGRRPKSR